MVAIGDCCCEAKAEQPIQGSGYSVLGILARIGQNRPPSPNENNKLAWSIKFGVPLLLLLLLLLLLPACVCLSPFPQFSVFAICVPSDNATTCHTLTSATATTTATISVGGRHRQLLFFPAFSSFFPSGRTSLLIKYWRIK